MALESYFSYMPNNFESFLDDSLNECFADPNVISWDEVDPPEKDPVETKNKTDLLME